MTIRNFDQIKISNSLDVLGTTNLNSVIVGENAGINGNLTVSQDTVLKNNLNVEGALDVYGLTRTLQGLEVTSGILCDSMRVTGPSILEDELDVTGSISLHGGLSVNGDSYLQGTLGVTGATNLLSTLDVTGEAVFKSDLQVLGETIIQGSALIQEDLNINGGLNTFLGANINGNLSVSNATVLKNNLNVDGNTELSTLTVNGASNFIGTVTVPHPPQQDTHAVTKKYVDEKVQGLNVKKSCRAATKDALPSCEYKNGSDGVGATLTSTDNITLPQQDGVQLEIGDRLLVKNQIDLFQNGMYEVTEVGGVTPFVLTRTDDNDKSTEIISSFTFIQEGTYQKDTGWVCTTDGPVVLGSSLIEFVQFSSAGLVTASEGLTKIDNDIQIQDYSIQNTKYAPGSVDKDAIDQDAIRTNHLGVIKFKIISSNNPLEIDPEITKLVYVQSDGSYSVYVSPTCPSVDFSLGMNVVHYNSILDQWDII